MALLMPLIMSSVLLPSAGATDPTCNIKCEDDTQCAVTGSNCTWCLPDHSGVQRCTTQPTECGGGPPLVAKTSFPQYFVVGDSVSFMYTDPKGGDLPGILLKKGFEAVEMRGSGGGEAGDTNQGLQCLLGWVGHNKSRFNVVSWNFGLHDLGKPTWDAPNYVSLADYEKNLKSISRLFDRRMPIAKQLYVTTTPVPSSSALAPPRNESDVLIYNTAAKKVMSELGLPVLDVWTLMDEACRGDPYTECPAGCAELPGGETANCLQHKDNVHFEPQGSRKIANALAEAVDVLYSGSACSDLLRRISIGLCHIEPNGRVLI